MRRLSLLAVLPFTVAGMCTQPAPEPPGDFEEDPKPNCLSDIPAQSVRAQLLATIEQTRNQALSDDFDDCVRPRFDMDEADVRHSADAVDPQPATGAAHILAQIEASLVVDDAALDLEMPCGDGPHGFTLCAGESFGSGPAFFSATGFEASLATDPWSHGTYALVFDRDGSADNNWQAVAPFSGDFYEGTDTWAEVQVATEQLTLTLTDALTANPVAGLAVRVLIAEDVLVWIVGGPGLDPVNVPYRHTAFFHTGDFGMSGGDWTGDTEPAVGAKVSWSF